MNKDKALRLALEAMKINNKAWKLLADSGDAGNWEAEEQGYYQLNDQTITAIKEALKTKDEPVAWMSTNDVGFKKSEFGSTPTVPLYTTPPQRTWVGLTEEDLKLLSAEWRIVYGAWMDDFARDIEAKLKERNT